MIENKIKGVVFGQAIGDAIGLGTEFLSKKEVKEYYPKGLHFLTDIVRDRHRTRWESGAWTDDTDQMLCILKSINKLGNLDYRDVARNLIDWFDDNPMGIGQTVYKVLTMPNYLDNPHKAAKIIWKMSGRKGAANGAVMRTSILGCYQYENTDNVVKNAIDVCRITHYDSRCVASCIVVCLIISNYLNGIDDWSVIKSEIIKYTIEYEPDVESLLNAWSNNSIEDFELDNPKSMGFTYKTAGVAVWSLFNCDSFEEGISKIVHQGGDADTNAAVAGSLLGAKLGFENIPERWISQLKDRRMLENELKEFYKVCSIA